MTKILTESDIIITMLPDGKAVRTVWEEILNYLKPSQIIIDCSTIDVNVFINSKQSS